MLSKWAVHNSRTRCVGFGKFLHLKPTSSTCDFGVVLDIDGVLIRGGSALPKARQVLLDLKKKRIPHIFMTNGGGCSEEAKARELTEILDVPINSEQLVLSHTPMRQLVEKYKDSRILVLGSNDVENVATHYGFTKITNVEEIVHQNPSQYPFRRYDRREPPYATEPISAAMIMHDPTDWALEFQVLVDVLIGGDPPGVGRPCGSQTPLYVSNRDFTFAGAYPAPRFAQGSFTDCLMLLYEKMTQKKLEFTCFGKPFPSQYKYAEMLLEQLSGQRLSRIYGIGDNPDSDVQGANLAKNWTSILLKTGIYDGKTHPTHKPDFLCETIGNAIDWIYDQHRVSPT